MSSKKKNTESRHGKLSEGRSQTSITMRKELMDKAKAEAEREGRSLSNFIEQIAKRYFDELEKEGK